MENAKLYFSSDYMEGAHPEIIKRLTETNLEHTAGYGFDEYSESARKKIRVACKCPEAAVYFLVGGTQTNATVLGALLRPWQGVLCASTGHIAVHEAGAIEHGGHKVLPLPEQDGKIKAEQISDYISTYYADENCEHMVMPGAVYLSQPTEFGTIYSKAELTAISEVCRKNSMALYVDGARLAYALSCPENDVMLPDLAVLCDVFYIGGTKCGALFGEAVVIPNPDTLPHFFTITKQNGALVAKGRITGLQFDTLFTGSLYTKIGVQAILFANRIRIALNTNGYKLIYKNPTNQVFAVVNRKQLEALSEYIVYGFWENLDSENTVIRFATSWATTEEDIKALENVLKKCK